jgi:putative hydrolase of the HAD superfamily
LIKAVFFDWFNTLARYNPPREKLQSEALREFGIEVSPEVILPAILTADKDLFDEQAITPITKRSPEEQMKIYTRYQQTVLDEIGVDISDNPGIVYKILKKAQELYGDIDYALFDDVLPTLKSLKEKNLTMGLVTNMDMDMRPVCKELGLGSYLNFFITSFEVGADKPQPQIFLEALTRAGVEAPEALHVGDQYKIDAVGAMGVGINALLLDRFNQYPEITDCPLIHGLDEVTGYL